jgi:RNA polymerase sigma-70 factor, ECF subfamily
VVDTSEAEIIARCQKGDEDALRELFNRYHQKVYRIAYGVVRQREDALDVVQDVFLKLFRSIRNYKGDSRFYTYLYRMTMNAAIDHTRKTGKVIPFSLDEEGAPEPAERPEQAPDRLLLRKELDGKIQEALSRLPDDQRAALLFREVEGLSYQEIAEAMGCSIGTVMSRLHYGRKKAQRWLKEYLNAEERG